MKAKTQYKAVDPDRELFKKLKFASFYQVYHNDLQTVTGFPRVVIVSSGSGFGPSWRLFATRNPSMSPDDSSNLEA